MARGRSSSSSSSSSSNKWRYLNPAYYLKRPKRLATLFILFVCVSFFVWDRQTLVREHEVEISKLNEEVTELQNTLEEIKNIYGDVSVKVVHKEADTLPKKVFKDDPLDIQRREKVKEAMLHAWTSYETYAWGQDELQPQTKNGVNSFGGLGATLVDSLDTLFIMGLKEQFQKAREWVAKSLDFNKDYEASVLRQL
ncbi:unnamed protein product [Rhodiola kirilowii]